MGRAHHSVRAVDRVGTGGGQKEPRPATSRRTVRSLVISMQWRSFLLPQLLLLAQQLHAVGFGSFRLAGALDGRGNLPVEKLIRVRIDQGAK